MLRIALPVCLLCLRILSVNAEDASAKIPFKKTGRVVLDLGGPGSFDECHAKYPCVLKIGDDWWMWYNGRARDCFTGAIGLATSHDGLNWTKQNGGQPVLRTGEKGDPDSTKVDRPAVLQFGGQLHMWFTMGDDRSRYTIGYATSDNGIRWTKQNDGQPVIQPGEKGKFDAQNAMHPCVLQTPDGMIHMWYFGRPNSKSGFSIGHATSQDGTNWKKENNGNAVLRPQTIGGLDELAVYNCCVLHQQEMFHMWYSAAYKHVMNRYAERSGGIRYAHSADGTYWSKDPSPVFFNGAAGTIDEYSAFAPSVVRRENGLWMYYSIAHLANGKGDRRRNRVGLAVEVKP